MIAGAWKEILMENCGLDPAGLVLVGVSGGPDSLALLDILVRSGCRVETAHFNHHLREEAGADAQAARAAAEIYRVRHHTGEARVARLARQEKLTIEEAARKARYRFLFQTAAQIGAAALAVGHTADDQVETILMHLLRGSGLAGLRGMPWRGILPEFDARIPLVRPLLGMWREETLAYCRENNLQPVTDASNLDTAYYRNRLRLELVPYLEQYNPRVRELVWRTGQILQGDFETVEAAAAAAEKTLQMEEGKGYVRFSRQRFLEQPAGVRRSLVRRMIARLRCGERDLDFDTVARALDFVEQPARSGGMELALGLSLALAGGDVFLKETGLEPAVRDCPRLEGDGLALQIPGKTVLGEGWELTAELVDRGAFDPDGAEAQDRMTAFLDAGKLPGVLSVRRRKPGDRMRPYGFGGHSIKVSDIWVNMKLPRPAREAWPLVCGGETIAWLPGYRPGAEFAVDGTTRRVVRLTLKKA